MIPELISKLTDNETPHIAPPLTAPEEQGQQVAELPSKHKDT